MLVSHSTFKARMPALFQDETVQVSRTQTSQVSSKDCGPRLAVLDSITSQSIPQRKGTTPPSYYFVYKYYCNCNSNILDFGIPSSSLK